MIFIIEIAVLIAIILGCIVLIRARKVPVNYAKQIVGNKQFGGARQFLPLKVNSAGVMPIIFAQAIMFLPTLVTIGGGQTLEYNVHGSQNFWLYAYLFGK